MKVALKLVDGIGDDESVYETPAARIEAASLHSTLLVRSLQRYKVAPDSRSSSDLIVKLGEALATSQSAVRLLRAEALGERPAGCIDEEIYRGMAIDSVANDRVMCRKLAAARAATLQAFSKTMEHLSGLTQSYELKTASTLKVALRAHE